MKKNMGFLDRLIRTIVAILIVVLYLTDQLSGIAAIILGVVAVAFLITSLFGFCLAYLPFKISTKKEPPIPVK